METNPTTDAPKHGALASVEISTLRESKLNPRRTVDPARMAELVESVRSYGILQPLVVRRNGTGDTLEVLAGHRRLRAAREAGLEWLPVVIRELDDRQAIELMIIENLQREDLHPLEEAECYRQLHELHGHPVEDLAAQVGKSKAYIYSRLQLIRLPDEARRLFTGGRLTAATALLVTKLASDQQLEAARRFAGVDGRTGKPMQRFSGVCVEPMTLAEAKEAAEDFMTYLRAAPWKLTDAELVPEAGACSTCPKRTGAQPELFGDTSRNDSCLDHSCFGKKREAFQTRALEEAAAMGRTVLEGKEAEKAIRGAGVLGSGSYLNLSEREHLDPKIRPLRQLLGKKTIEDLGGGVVAVGEDGVVHELVPRKEAAAALGSKYEWAKRATARERAGDSRNTVERRKRLAQVEAGRAVVAEVMTAAEHQEKTEIWHAVAAGVIAEVWADAAREVCRRRGIEPPKRRFGGPDHCGALRALLGKMTSAEARLLALELLVSGWIIHSTWDVSPGKAPVDLACKALGVNRQAIAARVRRQLEKKAPKKKASKHSGRK